MFAYKFLAAGAIAPFTERAWPLPGSSGPGAWIVAPQLDLARYGVHACRLEDLSYWPDEQLWVVELAESIVSARFHVAAQRARLVHRISAWNGASAREYAAACAWRGRDLVTEALDRAALLVEASALRACQDLGTLQASATKIAGDEVRDQPRGLAAYAAGAAMRATQGHFREASLQTAHLGAALAGNEAGAEHERAWQALWLEHRLQLREVAARVGMGVSPL